MMIVAAVDSFKGCLDSLTVGNACREGILSVMPDAEVRVVAVADGGEGTVAAVMQSVSGRIKSCRAAGPLGEPVTASYGISANGSWAIMEMAQAAGLTLVPKGRCKPMLANTFGCGEMILDALDEGCRKIYMGLGGSATTDAGMGMLSALGVIFKNKKGYSLHPSGESLMEIDSVDFSDIDPRLREVEFRALSDVENPLFGPEGAAYVFAAQKGASADEIEKLDSGLRKYAGVLNIAIGRDIAHLAGAGAAGGLGAAFLALGSTIQSGVETVLDLIGFEKIIADAQLVITGEGRMDMQTLMGKTPYGIMKRAQRAGIPTVGICGKVEAEAIDRLQAAGFRAIYPVNAGQSPEQYMLPAVARANISRAAGIIALG